VSFSLHSGPSAQFGILRRALQEIDYTAESICARGKFKTIFEFTLKGIPDTYAVKDGVDALMRLLLRGDAVPAEQMQSLVPAAITGALEELGVVARMGTASDFFATVQLYPVESLYIVSDRPNPLDPERAAVSDSVFTAISWNTALFLNCLPRSRCDSLLELCAGTGIAALACAAEARQAWACDLAGRCVRFAEFNARLNGIENVICAQGDMYEPVQEMTFDRIVAHPPYVPAAKQEVLYRDGGVDGEQVLRRAIEGVPRHLRPGGLFYAFTMASDRKEDTFEKRIRQWLGDREQEFDVLLVQADPGGKPDPEKLQGLNITNVFFTAVLIAHVNKPRTAVTARTRKAVTAGTDVLEWFMAWQRAAVAPGFDEWLKHVRPHLAPGFKLVVEHSVSGRALEATRFELRNEYPFSVAVPCPGWAAMVVSACDGNRTAREVFAELQTQKVLAAEMTEAAFVADMKEMLARGFLELDEFPLPVRR